MKTWGVDLPISGRLYIEVEADTEDEAIEKALNSALTIDMIEEWEAHERITEGNVCHAIFWEAEATE